MLSAGMREQEYERLRELLAKFQPQDCLEIGMANGGSSVVICQAIREQGEGRHRAIDPFQTVLNGFNGRGLEAVRKAGLTDSFELIEDFDYLALPKLVTNRQQFDFILIDGWHSFDYTFVDIFYADLLLKVGGVLAVHDSGWPSVYRACRFLETHKPYERLSPPISVVRKSFVGRIARRIGQFLGGPRYYREMAARRNQWFSLAAYVKRADQQVANDYHCSF